MKGKCNVLDEKTTFVQIIQGTGIKNSMVGTERRHSHFLLLTIDVNVLMLNSFIKWFCLLLILKVGKVGYKQKTTYRSTVKVSSTQGFKKCDDQCMTTIAPMSVVYITDKWNDLPLEDFQCSVHESSQIGSWIVTHTFFRPWVSSNRRNN